MKILVAPLNWGLGHAARCIPIIRYLLEKNCEVVIGADGRPLELLKKEFPLCQFIFIRGYDISYPKKVPMALKIAVQIPEIVHGIKREHKELERMIRTENIDAVISDNRFGLWSRKVPCVFITHQIMVKSPSRWLSGGEKFIYKLNRKYISRFTECWVPDVPDGLSGDLSHKFPLLKNARFIGFLSRFGSCPASHNQVIKNKLLVILSGPEPQRTIFEDTLLKQLSSLKIKTLIVQGKTEKDEMKKISEHVQTVSYLTSDALLKEILSAEIILSRSGYSTIMDLAVLGKKAIFVPTPGQTEQEYLAMALMKKKIAYASSQKSFDLSAALKEAKHFTGFAGNFETNEFKKAVDELLIRYQYTNVC